MIDLKVGKIFPHNLPSYVWRLDIGLEVDVGVSNLGAPEVVGGVANMIRLVFVSDLVTTYAGCIFWRRKLDYPHFH